MIRLDQMRLVSSAIRSRTRSGLLHLALAAVTLVLACGPDPAPAQTQTTAPSAPVTPAGQTPAGRSPVREYDLAADEKLGGHTLERHVGRTDADLAERLRHESNISAASTYDDAATARRVVAAAIDRNRGRLQTWSDRNGPRPNL